MLSMQNISKVYRTDLVETHALRDFSVDVGDGEFVAVTGPSGSGKTTFLNIAGMLESFSSGTYMLDNEDVSGLNDNDRSADDISKSLKAPVQAHRDQRRHRAKHAFPGAQSGARPSHLAERDYDL